MPFKTTALVTALTLMFASSVQAEETHYSHAHEHGIAEMNVVQAGQELFIEVISPAHNVFGFEHAPHNQNKNKKLNSK